MKNIKRSCHLRSLSSARDPNWHSPSLPNADRLDSSAQLQLAGTCVSTLATRLLMANVRLARVAIGAQGAKKDERKVHSHEVPRRLLPEEYLNQD